jgi:hypothetical protein
LDLALAAGNWDTGEGGPYSIDDICQVVDYLPLFQELARQNHKFAMSRDVISSAPVRIFALEFLCAC